MVSELGMTAVELEAASTITTAPSTSIDFTPCSSNDYNSGISHDAYSGN